MSGSKVIGPGVAGGAMLPVTGSPTATLVVAGLAAIIGGLLLVRAARYHRR